MKEVDFEQQRVESQVEPKRAQALAIKERQALVKGRKRGPWPAGYGCLPSNASRALPAGSAATDPEHHRDLVGRRETVGNQGTCVFNSTNIKGTHPLPSSSLARQPSALLHKGQMQLMTCATRASGSGKPFFHFRRCTRQTRPQPSFVGSCTQCLRGS